MENKKEPVNNQDANTVFAKNLTYKKTCAVNEQVIEKAAEDYGFKGVFADDYHPHPNCDNARYTSFKRGAEFVQKSYNTKPKTWWNKVWDACKSEGMPDHSGSGMEQVISFLESKKAEDDNAIKTIKEPLVNKELETKFTNWWHNRNGSVAPPEMIHFLNTGEGFKNK